MTYLDLIKFYYSPDNGTGNDSSFYLKVAGKSVDGVQLKVSSYSVTPTPGTGQAGDEVDIVLVPGTALDTTIYLGNLPIGTDKALAISATYNSHEETTNENYKNAKKHV